jgi:LCP family protein required for cell wall assembly
MFSVHGGARIAGKGAGIAGKAVYAVGCVLAATTLVASGAASYVVKAANFGGSDVITGGPSTGAMNILLMGLESRTDYDGNVLSAGLLAAMHAGSVQGVTDDGVGGQDTNTLIIIHIFAGGKKAVGFSIPRDDWVTYPKAYDGETQGKIDEAYGLAWAQSLSQTANSSMSRDQRYLLANEAGQAATIATVEAVTGQHIDHFAEVNLAGFYELAQVFNGVEVCVKSWNGGQNLHDANSGFNQPHAGYLHLSAPQTLAFVRERDNLPNGDLDRTHRQQAVIDYVIWSLEHEGVFTSIGQLTSLLNIAKQYVITDQGWQILDFASEMHALTGRNLTFETAPIAGYATYYPGGVATDANVIDVSAIQADVKQAFTAPATSPGEKSAAKSAAQSLAPGKTTVDVYNGGNTPGLAGQLSQALTAAGFEAGKVGNAAAQSSTQVLYGTGASASAAKIAGYFTGVSAAASSSVAAGHVEVLLGSDATSVPSGIGSASASSGSATSPASSPASSSASNNGAAGGAVTVAANAQYGIPCVY